MGVFCPLVNRLLRVRVTTAVRFLSLSLVTCFACFSLSAQSNTGRILGVITDQTGGAMAGATVTVTDIQRGVSRTLTTDQTGAYLAPNLVPGTYSVRAEAKGFKTVEHSNILLEVGKDVRVDLTLQTGEQTQEITVTGEVANIDTTNATLGGTLSNETINDLPLNGRNFTNLLSLRPGVTVYPGGGARTQSTNGIRAEDQVYMVDGLNNIEPYTGYNIVNSINLAGDAGTLISIDAIQEFNTVENPPAEYGWKPGAVVNVGIKSGTNTVHGTAYAYGRNGSWDARNYFNPVTQPQTPAEVEQFGATLGGPIKKDKLFYFLSFEDQRYSVGSLYSIVAPVTASIGNAKASLLDACNAAAGLGPLSANSLKLAGLGPGCTQLPNYPGLFPVNNGPTTSYANNQTSVQQNDNGLAKGDYQLNQNNTLSGMYYIGRGSGTFNDAPNEVQPFWLSVAPMRVQVASGSWTWLPKSNWVNELRVGEDRFFRSFLSADSGVNPQNYVVNGSNYSLNTGVTNPAFFGFPIIRFNSFNSGLFRLGANWPKIVGPNGVFQIIDHVSYLHGNHAFKFGGEFLYDTDDSQITSNAKGQIRFASLTSFFQGVTNSNSQILIAIPNAIRHVSSQGYALFAQDDWRIKPRLTLNLGLRWEMNTVLKESNNLFGNFSPTQGLQQVGNQIASPYNGDHNNFAPRLGLAWDINGNGKTVLRAGASVVYEELSEYQVFLGLGNALGMGTVPTGAIIDAAGNTAGGNIQFASITFGKGALNWNGSSVGGSSIFPTSSTLNCFANPCTIYAVDPNLHTPYVTNWTLDLQRAVTNSLTLDIGYVGNHGSGLLGYTDMNQAPVGVGWAGAPAAACLASATDPQPYDNCSPSASAEQASRPFAPKFPYLSYIDRLSNLDTSNYQGLQVALTQRTSHGLSFLLGYTYSHALDDVSENYGTGTGVPINSAVPNLYGPSDFDIRHRFTLSTTYALPGKKSPAQLLEGWQVNSVVTLQSGQPWYPQDTSNDFAGNGEIGNPATLFERWDFFGNPSDFTSNQYPIPYFAGVSNPQCLARAQAIDGAPVGLAQAALANSGCFAKGNSILLPPAYGTEGNMGRNIFRDSGFRDWDISIVKNTVFKERLTAQFRAEFFNILNHPNFANPYGGPNGYANNDPSGGLGMGCGCTTPDQAAQNPVLGTGGPRAIQLGLKLIF